jgi:ribonuclease P protein component
MNKKTVIIKNNSNNLNNNIIVVSKKYSKKAVERNKMKRKIREILNSISKNKKYKIIVNSSAKFLSYEELKKEIIKSINE